jgi:hypothetical protein
MWVLFQYGGVGSGSLSEFLVATFVLVGIPIVILTAGQIFEKFF